VTKSKTPSKSRVDQAQTRSVALALTEAFWCQFHLWPTVDFPCRGSSGAPPVATNQPGIFTEFSERSPAVSGEPFLIEQAHDRHLLVIPIRQNGKARLAAMASFKTSAPELLMKLARSFVREFDQREELRRHTKETQQLPAEAGS
jgi:hypothetical protein